MTTATRTLPAGSRMTKTTDARAKTLSNPTTRTCQALFESTKVEYLVAFSTNLETISSKFKTRIPEDNFKM